MSGATSDMTGASEKTFRYFASLYQKIISHKSPKTRALVEYILKRYLLPAFGKKKIKKITEHDFELYVARMATKVRVYNHIKYFKAVMKTARKMGITLPLFDVPCPDPISEKLKLYTPEELGKLLHACRGNKRKRRLRLFILFLFTTGLRKSQILSTKWEWVFFGEGNTGEIYYPSNSQKKTRTTQPRIIPLNGTLVIILKAWRRRFPHDEYIFQCRWEKYKKAPRCMTDIDTEWSRLCEETGIRGSIHSARATVATWLTTMLGGDMKSVCLHLRMSEKVLERHYLFVPTSKIRFATNNILKFARKNVDEQLKMARSLNEMFKKSA